MRTTLDIDQDVLDATKEIAARTKRTAGHVASELIRKALTLREAEPRTGKKLINGFEVLPANGRVVTVELVDQLLDDSDG